MSIQEKINDEIKLSMKEKNVDKLSALRSVKSAILLELTKDGKTNMSDEIAIQIISKLVKQRKESASIFKSKNRLDLEKEELSQIKYLEIYLPKQLSEDEIEEFILKCKQNEDEKGYLKQSFFKFQINKRMKFLNGPFANMIFNIIEVQKNKLKILLDGKNTIISKKNYLFSSI